MAYIVDVNDPNQPSNNKGAGQAAEELRAIKLKISALTRDPITGNWSINVPIAFSRGLTVNDITTNTLEASSATISGALTFNGGKTPAATADLSNLQNEVAGIGTVAANAVNFPGGLQIRFGTGTANNNHSFSSPFPNACISVQITNSGGGNHAESICCGGLTAAGFFSRQYNYNDSFSYVAFGY